MLNIYEFSASFSKSNILFNKLIFLCQFSMKNAEDFLEMGCKSGAKMQSFRKAMS
jgi:hypothetical protein